MTVRPPLFALVATLALLLPAAARADVTVGVSLPLTGPASSLGIPLSNQVKLWPATVAGEKLNVVLVDDANKGVDNARRFVESNADLVLGSVVTPVAVAQHLNEAQVPHFSLAPIVLPAGKDAWSFRLPQSNAMMAGLVLDHMKRAGVKTIGFLGYSDAYGEGWLTEMNRLLPKHGGPGMKIVGVERFARSDASVAGQALKLVAAQPDAILVVASGGGAALPQKALVERGYKGRIYQTHAAASRDFLRLSGKDADGAFVAAGPSIVPEQLPASHPSKALAADYVQRYESVHGAGTRSIFAASAYDMVLILQKVIPVALKAGKPGTLAFRTALRDATEQMGPTAMANGVMNFTRDDHWGHTSASGVMLKVGGGDWKVVD
jgi:branched-chain amino acid transport system substrate-binding protein